MNKRDVLIKSKFCFGPMSKNIVDSIIEYSNQNKIPFTLIPSRRQIEYNGGYVNNWTTEEFAKYVYSKSQYIAIQRDHGGPGQGSDFDDGYDSLMHDCKWFDSVHIDPWKSYPNIEDGIQWTIDMILYCYNINPNLYFEVGTEESIRKFDPHEIDHFLSSIKQKLGNKVFQRILFCVIQSGTGLKNGVNTGIYDKARLEKMIQVVNKYDLQTKEHNGDFMMDNIMSERFKTGLSAINIAPELGILETKTILQNIDRIQYQILYDLCYESQKWKKWVDDDFIPEENKTTIIELSLHYLFSNQEFENMKHDIFYCSINIDKIIKENIYLFIQKLIYSKTT